MKMNYSLLVIVCIILIAVHCAGTDLEVKGDSDTGSGQKISLTSNQNNSSNEKTSGSDSNLDSKKVVSVKKGEDKVGGSKEGVQSSNLDKDISGTQLESKEAPIVKTNANGNKLVKEGADKDKVDEGSKSKELPKEGILPPTRKESFRGEECGSSNNCTDDNNALVACLRVPGNESPDLSLLIQNKGKGPLSVTVSAPDFVWLEKTQIQLREKEDKKVKVSVKKGGIDDNLIVLTAGNGNCKLDFRDLIAHSLKMEADYTSQSTNINLVKWTSPIGFKLFAAILTSILIWACVRCCRRHFASNGSKHQKLYMELPVSGGDKKDSDLSAGWDDSWGDSWDDEEAPKTPSMPVTPSLSSKGVSSRRVNKEGWKD